MIRKIALATLIAGTLDIAMAAIDTAAKDRPVDAMLRAVASGPFPGAREWGMQGAIVGLAVHFVLIAIMATVFLLAWRYIRLVRDHPLIAGALYGVGLWLTMYGLVLPVRFGAAFPTTAPAELAKQLFAHVVLVGLVFGWIASRPSPLEDESADS
jgi:hypothetical protein